MFKLITIIAILAAFCSCTKSKLQTAIKMAGDNKKELLAVLDYYSKKEPDSLKLRAAQFLIENMPYHYYFEQQLFINGEKTKAIKWSCYNLKNINQGNLKPYAAFIDSLNIRVVQGNNIKWDIENINSQQLIENIEYAFKAWELPWCKHLSFDDFCKYILPHRCKSEPLSDWRRSFYEQYSQIKDSLPAGATPYEACAYLQNILKKQVFWSSKYSGFYSGFLPPALFQNIKIGSCENLACYTSLVMRSVGIPVLYDAIPCWPRREVGHAYNWLLANDTASGYLFGVTDRPPDIPRSPNGATKVYRQTYEIHENPIWKIWEQGGYAPPSLINQHHFDVTNQYCTVNTFSYKLNSENSSEEIIWLCNITPKGLRPIDFCYTDKNGLAGFDNVTQNLFALAKYNQSGILLPVSPPFIHKRESTHFFVPKNDSLENYCFEKRLDFDGERNGLKRKVDVQYWDNGWVNIDATAVVAEDINPQKKKQKRLFTLKLDNVPKGTVFYLKEANSWFTFDSTGKYNSVKSILN